MQVGSMDQRVTLKSRSVVADAMGQDVITWTDVITVWARLVNQRSAEVIQAAQIGDDNIIELHIRHRPEVLSTWRLEMDGVGYDITSATDFGGRKDRTRLLCRKGVKDGR